MSGRVQDRVIVVTGAAGGQGAAEVAALNAEDAIVIATDLEAAIGPPPERVHNRHLNVTDPVGWRELAEWAARELGRVDALINNAGTTSRVRLGEVSLEEWNWSQPRRGRRLVLGLARRHGLATRTRKG